MTLKNYDEMFAEYLADYMDKHGDEYENEDAMEEAVPDLYNNWLDQYIGDFEIYTEPEELIDMLFEYSYEKIPVPDLLCDRLTMLPGGNVSMTNALRERECTEEMQMLLINLLRETGSSVPTEWFLWKIENSEVEDEVADNAAEAVRAIGTEAFERVKEVFFSTANPEAKYRLLDTVIDAGQDEDVYEYIVERFNNEDKAIYAPYLARYGDEKALPLLQKELRNTKLDYIEYMEIRNAIEQLGGVPEINLSFDGDKYYEALRKRAEKI